METRQLITQLNLILDKALYYLGICDNEITNEYLDKAKELLTEHSKKVEG